MANVFVTADIKEQGAKLIQDGSGSSVRNGVELLLKNDLCFGNEEGKPPSDAVNAGRCVKQLTVGNTVCVKDQGHSCVTRAVYVVVLL